MRSMPNKSSSLMTDAMRAKLREKIRGQAVARTTKVHFPPFAVPEGCTAFVPSEKGWYELDILLYTITDKFHPSEMPAGSFWYVRPFDVHVGLGSSKRDILCPRSVNQLCVFCNELDRIRAKHGWQYPLPRGLRPTPFGAYYAIDPGSGSPVIMAWNVSKFGKFLEKELAQSELDIADFAQAVGGRRVRFRVGEDTFEGRKFLTTDKIEFEERDDLDESLLAQAPALDECLQPLEQETLQELFESLFQEGTEPADDDDATVTDEEAPRRVIGRPVATVTGRTTSARPNVQNTPRRVATAAPEPEPLAEEPGELEIPPGHILCVACEGKGKSSRGGTCQPCQGNGYIKAPAATAAPARRRAAAPPPEPELEPAPEVLEHPFPPGTVVVCGMEDADDITRGTVVSFDSDSNEYTVKFDDDGENYLVPLDYCLQACPACEGTGGTEDEPCETCGGACALALSPEPQESEPAPARRRAAPAAAPQSTGRSTKPTAPTRAAPAASDSAEGWGEEDWDK